MMVVVIITMSGSTASFSPQLQLKLSNLIFKGPFTGDPTLSSSIGARIFLLGAYIRAAFVVHACGVVDDHIGYGRVTY